MRIVLLVLLAIVLTAGSTFGFGWMRYQGNIKRSDVSNLVPSAAATPVDSLAGQALNILVLGSDTRAGASNIDGVGEEGGMRADTTMIVHISADRQRVEVVSIPRDILVDIPPCTVRTSPNGQETRTMRKQYNAMFNSAFSLGGTYGDIPSAAACSMNTLHELTGLTFHGYVVVDFASFVSTVDALGGIPIYIQERMKDKYAGLDLEPGCRLLHGQSALAFARARKQLGDGSDVSRITRQHKLVSAVFNEALKTNMLTNIPTLMRFLDAATQSLQTSKEIGNISNIVGLANSLSHLNINSVKFWTMPYDPADNRVTPNKTAKYMWEALIKDLPINAEKHGGNGNVRAMPPVEAQQAPSAAPSQGAQPQPAQPEQGNAPSGATQAHPAPQNSASSSETPQPTQTETLSPEELNCTRANAK